jgi:NAD(P)-dependent dehydrogenase (short-subunit alcohol dehydrogenase family)
VNGGIIAAVNGIDGSTILMLGGGGMVGTAICRELLAGDPARIAVAARREAKARRAVDDLRAEFPALAERILPVWGDVFLRSEWQGGATDVRGAVLDDTDRRRRAIDDVLDPLDDAILQASHLYALITGTAAGLDGRPADIVIDCMNTATAVSYQNVYAQAGRLRTLARQPDGAAADWPREVESLLSALSAPQLVRHVQILYAAMRAAGSRAYIKIGTSGTGGMGFNIPYTHGEEKPSRLLLTKAALAGAQTLLTFLLARTPDAPPLVREIKPTAMIGWRRIDHGPVHVRGKAIPVVDCAPDDAVDITAAGSLAPQGDFGTDTGETLSGVYIDTGENGLFSADEFAAITTLGQMQMITPEDIAATVMTELQGGTTGHDVVAALDGAVSGPTYRAGALRQAALTRLRRLEAEHGAAVAYEVLGPPRLSKLLFEAALLKEAVGAAARVVAMDPDDLATALARRVETDTDLRRRMLSAGIPVLLPGGARLLRGPVIKADTAHAGWVDCTAANMRAWQARLAAVLRDIAAEAAGDSSSRHDRLFATGRDWTADGGFPDPGDIAGWIFLTEEHGRRQK